MTEEDDRDDEPEHSESGTYGIMHGSFRRGVAIHKLTDVPDYVDLFVDDNMLSDTPEQLAATLRKLTEWAYSPVILNVAARSIAEQFLAEAVDAETRAQDWWCDATNQWVNEHAWALVCWMISGAFVILFCLAYATDPALVNAIDGAMATPVALISLALAVWSLRKPKN